MMEQEEFVGPVNIGNPEEVKIIDLAKLILEFTGSTSRISLKSLPADDPIRRCPDITLAREKLGWSPATPLIKGLKKTFPYFKEKLKKLRK